MRTLMGGCSVPICALAHVKENGIEFTGAIHSFDGKRSFWLKRKYSLEESETAGEAAANEILKQPGAKELIEEIRKRDME
jgi:hydroxymethylbilane synthase